MSAQGKIFISYRREDSPGDARGICDRLSRAFGAANVFMDVDRLLAGQRFDRELEKALAKCDVLIAVIGSRWVEILSDYVQCSKRDYVRDEIAAALRRDIIVIPVMIGREANMPPLPLADDLPENIRELVLYQKHNIAHETFGRDAAELVAALKVVLSDRRPPRPWRAIAIAALIGLLLTAALLGYWQDMIPWIGSSGQQQSAGTNDATIAARPNPDVARKVGDARQQAEADAKAAEDAARKKAAEDARLKAEADAKAAEDAARKKAAEDARLKAEADAKAAEDAARKKAEEDARQQAEADAKAAEEAARKKAAEDALVMQKAFGLDLATLSKDLRTKYKIQDSVKGVIVTGVDGNSEAAERRLSAGDVIVEVAQEAVSSAADIQKRVDQLKKAGKKSILLLVADGDGILRFVQLRMQ